MAAAAAIYTHALYITHNKLTDFFPLKKKSVAHFGKIFDFNRRLKQLLHIEDNNIISMQYRTGYIYCIYIGAERKTSARVSKVGGEKPGARAGRTSRQD